MSGSVVPFDRERRIRENGDESGGKSLRYCPCGDAWWVLIGGGLCFNEDLTVSGWAGMPVCKSCGAPMDEGRTPWTTG